MSVTSLAVPNPATTAWVPVNGPVGNLGGGFEFGYDQITASVNVTGTSEASPTMVIPGSAHTFDGNPVLFEFQAPFVQTDTTGNAMVYVALYEGSTVITRLGLLINPVASSGMYAPYRASFRYTPSAGSHTYSIKAWVVGAGGNIGAGPGGAGQQSPAYLRATSVAYYTGPGAGIPSPVVNGQWVKGVGGAAVWAAITPADIPGKAARVFNNATLGVTSGSWTTLTFNTTTFDNDSIFNGTSRLICKTAGVYSIFASVYCTGGGGLTRFLDLYLNGTTEIARGAVVGPSAFGGSTDTIVQVVGLWQMVVTDYVETRFFIDGASGAIAALNNFSPVFGMYRVA